MPFFKVYNWCPFSFAHYFHLPFYPGPFFPRTLFSGANFSGHHGEYDNERFLNVTSNCFWGLFYLSQSIICHIIWRCLVVLLCHFHGCLIVRCLNVRCLNARCLVVRCLVVLDSCRKALSVSSQTHIRTASFACSTAGITNN